MTPIHLARKWWALAIRGIAAVVFGVVALFWPAAAFAGFVLVFGAYATVDGIFNLVTAVRAPHTGGIWGPLVFEGIVSLMVGLITLFSRSVSAFAVVMFIAARSIVTGIAEVVAAIRLRKEIRGEWLLALSGILSLALGVLLFVAPAAGTLVLTIWIGAYALLFGTVMVGLSLRLRSWASRHPELPSGDFARQPA
jgi:uncharacterized membrane protein HdeD (DUF308 family)